MPSVNRFAFRAAVVVLSIFASSCSIAPTVPTHRLLMHRALIDFTGLRAVRTINAVKSSLATPIGWSHLVPTKGSLYTAEQWRSPSSQTGLGVAYVRLPLPLSAGAIRWFAKQEYARHAGAVGEGKIVSAWSDSLGRAWFEGENDKYHVRGYAVTHGLDAWVVFCGYRVPGTPDLAEMSLALRSVETIVPAVDGNAKPPIAANVARLGIK